MLVRASVGHGYRGLVPFVYSRLFAFEYRGYGAGHGKPGGPLPMDATEYESPSSDSFQMEHHRYLKRRYIPAKDDDRDIGDYPNVAYVNHQLRPRHPAVPYDDVQLRKYANEPLHEETDILSMHGPDPEPHYSLSYRIKACFGLIGGMLGVIFLIDYFDEPYLRAMAVPRKLFIDDAVMKHFEGRISNTVSAWPNYKDYKTNESESVH